MICEQSVLLRLEYPRLLELLAGRTQSVPGRELAATLAPLEDLQTIDTALTEVDESVRLLAEGRAPGLGNCPGLDGILEAGRAAGSLLPVEDLQQVGQALQAQDACRAWARQLEPELQLGQLGTGIVALPELAARLREAIGPRGELLDSASFELGELRSRIRRSRSRIKQQLEQLLNAEQYSGCFQERLIRVRNGRYVVPLKSDCRGRIKGFIQDESASGQTLYLEPARVLEGNNQLQQLLRDEQREERRVLLELADLVRRDSIPLLDNQRRLARIDLRFAAGRLSRAYQGCRPQLTRKPVIELKQARHPLLMDRDGTLQAEAAVPVDLLLPEDCQALVISGPNTGGKSVALKTLGLLLLMVRSGMHIPCHPDSRLHLFAQLQVDIGDEQSISRQLSTFAGHLLRLREILARADAETLVLLDEAGSATDPAEGAALVQAVLDQLCRQGVKCVLTTHLGQLKHFAHQRPEIANAAVEFDSETLLPTYRLHYGIPGASSALETARRLGLPAAVLEQARTYLGGQELDHSRLLTDLNARQQALDAELAQARRARSAAEAAQQLRGEQIQALKNRKKEILQRATQQAERLISDTEQRIRQLRKQQPGPVEPEQAVAQQQTLRQARQQLEPFKPRLTTAGGTPPGDLQTGELVRIVALGVSGEVTRTGGDAVELLVGGKRLKQPLSAVEPYQPRRFARAGQPAEQVTRTLSERAAAQQLKLVGRRVDEALVDLERFIDDALLAHLTRVEIVHGSGQGILRRAVREFLAAQATVTAFYAAPLEQGGDNVTIAELGGS